MAGHWWTVTPALLDHVRPVRAPSADPWQTAVGDPRLGTVRLRGLLREENGAHTVLVVVHGLGGDPDSPYCRRAAALASRRGWSCLRLGLRGSTGDGEDIYHAGLTSDLAHAITDPSLARYDRVLLVGYSLGGHLALGLATQPADGPAVSRLVAVAAVSAPLDLAAGCRAIDRRRAWPYRRHVLQGLKRGYRRVVVRRELSAPAHEVERVRTLREWDRLTVVPRFEFEDVDAYYRCASVGPRLHALTVPALYVGMPHDPMVPRSTVEASLTAAASSTVRLTTRWLDGGGHVAAPGSWEDDVLAWLDRQRRR